MPKSLLLGHSIIHLSCKRNYRESLDSIQVLLWSQAYSASTSVPFLQLLDFPLSSSKLKRTAITKTIWRNRPKNSACLFEEQLQWAADFNSELNKAGPKLKLATRHGGYLESGKKSFKKDARPASEPISQRLLQFCPLESFTEMWSLGKMLMP